MAARQPKPRRRFRFGIGEWYGTPLVQLSHEERRHFAQIQLLAKSERPIQRCPFLSRRGSQIACWKEGGVCSLRKYELGRDGQARLGEDTALRTICPSRLQEAGAIFEWIGDILLSDPGAVPIGQVNLKGLGNIDNVLVVPHSMPVSWCAVEIQSVYFSGKRMREEFQSILNAGDTIPFPLEDRRPDYRSSGPKRLMPQLQMEVPTLRRWGKKTAVVVDEHFFDAMGMTSIREVNHVSNCDIAWFVVTYDSECRLQSSRVCLTTLEQSVDTIVAAETTISLREFEQRILAKYARLGSSPT